MTGESLLVHVCCGPCAIVPLRELAGEGFALHGVFYNPNVHPLQEYARRREGARQVAGRLSVGLDCLDGEYVPAAYFRLTAGRAEDRCAPCYRLRLARTARLARERGFSAFTTTLLSSVFQKHERIREAGLAAEAEAGGPAFLYRDFRPAFREGVRLSREWGVYRQRYCGCLFSEMERYGPELLPGAKPAEG